MFKNSDWEAVVYVGIEPAPVSKEWNSKEVKPWPLAGGTVDITDMLEGVVVEKSAIHVLTTVVGPSDLDLGDNDDPDGYVVNASLSADSVGAGAYAAAPGKRYAAEGKKAILAVNGPVATAGLIAVVLKGYRI